MKYKVLESILLLFSIACLLVSCTQTQGNTNYRIKLKEAKNINGTMYTIIEVDSEEFLTQSNGGLVRISK